MEWISVNDQIPEFMENVILANRDGDVFVGWSEDYSLNGMPHFSRWEDIDVEEITHWMPMPKHPYKK
jgi:hypothetical protein